MKRIIAAVTVMFFAVGFVFADEVTNTSATVTKENTTDSGTTATSKDGAVTVDGTVTMQVQADEAIRVAKEVPGG